MDWRAKVELFEQIRRDYEFGVGTIRGVARKFGVHRRVHGEFVIMPPWASEIIRDNVLSIDMTSASRTH